MKLKYRLFLSVTLLAVLFMSGCTKHYALAKKQALSRSYYMSRGYAAVPPSYMPSTNQARRTPSSKATKKGIRVTSFTSKARLNSTMKPYWVRFHRYSPVPVSLGSTMYGVSSWYGPNFHGKSTSSGEQYNMHAFTAAHKTWPMDTMVRVDNLNNGKSVIVRINDRGPFVSGRVIDCSYAAGKAIGLDASGVANVRLSVVGFAGKVQSAQKKK